MSQFDENGINFHKLTKSLSTSALKYLISVAKQESFRRTKNQTFAKFENKDLPVLRFNAHTIVRIKDNDWKIASYRYAIISNETVRQENVEVTHNAYVPTYVINTELYKWDELVKRNVPIVLYLKNINNESVTEIELHSRSKIFWFHKLLENANEEPFERKFTFKESEFNSIQNL